MASGGAAALYSIAGTRGPGERRKRLTMQTLLGDYVKSCLQRAREGEPAVLIVDPAGLTIINACLSMSDLVGLGFRAVVELESWAEHKEGVRRPSLFPVQAVYYMRATPKNLAMVLDDFSEPEKAALAEPEDWMERWFPCVFAGIMVPEKEPTYGGCRLCFIPGPPKEELTGPRSNAALALAQMMGLAEREKEYARFPRFYHGLDPEVPPECPLEALPEEGSVFSLHMPDVLSFLYSSERRKDPSYKERIKQLLRRISYRLLTFCIAMNECPEIRWRETPESARRGIEGVSMARRVANYLKDYLVLYREGNPRWRPLTYASGGRGGADDGEDVGEGALGDHVTASGMQFSEPSGPAVMLVCERADDLPSVLAHHWSYQAALADVLGYEFYQPFDVHKPREVGKRPQVYRTVLLDRTDLVWSKIRHLNVEDARAMIRAGRKRTLDKEAAVEEMRAAKDIKGLHAHLRLQEEGGKVWDAKYVIHRCCYHNLSLELERREFVEDPDAGGEAGGEGGAAGGGGAAVSGLAGMFGIGKAKAGPLPEAEDTVDVYQVGDLEQVLLTGLFRDGTSWSAGRTEEEVRRILRSRRVSSAERARVLLLWMLTRPRVTYEERKALMDMARLDRAHSQAVLSVRNLGIPLDREGTEWVSGVVPKTSAARAKERVLHSGGWDSYSEPTIVQAVRTWAEAGEAPASASLKGRRGGAASSTPETDKPDLSEEEWPFVLGPFPIPSGGGGGSRSGLPGSRLRAGDDERYGGEEPDPAALAALAGAGGGVSKRRRGKAAEAPPPKGPPSSEEEYQRQFQEKTERFLEECHEVNPDPTFRGRRVIVFILGGVSPQEISELDRVSRATGVEIITGSTGIVTARDILRELNATERVSGELDAPLDAAIGAGTDRRPAAPVDSDDE